MKYIILVGDGMGDYALDQLNGKTPLEAVNKPAIDSLAQNGQLYNLKTVPEGYSPGSDVANLSLLGYRPEQFYTGRAPLEAASMNIILAEDEIAFRCNLVTIKHQGDGNVSMIDYSSGHISTPDASQLIQFLSEKFGNNQFTFYPGVSYRHLLVVSGTAEELQTAPPHDYLDKDVTEFWSKYKQSSFGNLLEKANSALSNHPINQNREKNNQNPANSIWLWGQGRSPEISTINELFGLSGTMISAVDLLKGIGVYAGMEIINVPGATGYLDTNYQGKVDAALNALQNKDLVFVHVEAPDEAGHQGKLDEKLQAIEDFDKKIVAPILTGLQDFKEFRIAITTDHYTPVSLRTHTSHPVPIAIYDSTKKFKGHNYTEANANTFGKSLDNGEQFLNELIGK